jgi:hypothetical protein
VWTSQPPKRAKTGGRKKGTPNKPKAVTPEERRARRAAQQRAYRARLVATASAAAYTDA